MRIGTWLAGVALLVVGAVAGLLTWDETIEWMKTAQVRS